MFSPRACSVTKRAACRKEKKHSWRRLPIGRGDKRLLASSYLSVCLSPIRMYTPRLPLDEFSWNFILGTYTEICRQYPILVKIGQRYQALYMKSSVLLYCWRQYEMFCSLTTEQSLTTVAFSWQQWKLLQCDNYVYVTNTKRTVAFPWQ